MRDKGLVGAGNGGFLVRSEGVVWIFFKSVLIMWYLRGFMGEDCVGRCFGITGTLLAPDSGQRTRAEPTAAVAEAPRVYVNE